MIGILTFAVGASLAGLYNVRQSRLEQAELHRQKTELLEFARRTVTSLEADLASAKKAYGITAEDENYVKFPHRVFDTLENRSRYNKILAYSYICKRKQVYKFVLDFAEEIKQITNLKLLILVTTLLETEYSALESVHYENNPEHNNYVRFTALQNDLLANPGADPTLQPRFAALATYIHTCVINLEMWEYLRSILHVFLRSLLLGHIGKLTIRNDLIVSYDVVISNCFQTTMLSIDDLYKIARTQYLIYSIIQTLSAQTDEAKIFQLKVCIATYRSLLVLQSLDLYEWQIFKQCIERGTEPFPDLMQIFARTREEYRQFHTQTYTCSTPTAENPFSVPNNAHTEFFIEEDIWFGIEALQDIFGIPLYCLAEVRQHCTIRNDRLLRLGLS